MGESSDSEEERKLYREKTQKGTKEGTMKEGEERKRGRKKDRHGGREKVSNLTPGVAEQTWKMIPLNTTEQE